MLLAYAGAVCAQSTVLHGDIDMRLKAMGIDRSMLTEERAGKLEAGYHPMLLNGHRNALKGLQQRGLQKKAHLTAQESLSYNTGKPFLQDKKGFLATEGNANVKKMAAEGVPEIMYGYVSYASNWEEDLYGLYSFTTASPSTFTPLPQGPDGAVAADGGGCYYDGKYYSITYAGFMGLILAEFCVYDAETWTMEKYIPVSGGSVSIDMDYDPTTGNIYGCFYNDDGDGLVFGYLNPENGNRTAICDLDRIFFGISVDSKGTVYGISEEGWLVTFDKQTGKQTKIGNTGLLQEYIGGMTFDLKTDRLYWSYVVQTGSALYEVNTQTAEATLVTAFPNTEEVQGMYIPIPAAEPGAPAKVEAVTATFSNGSLSGEVAFTMPSQTYSGDPLSGMLEYDIFLNDEPYSTCTAIAGCSVSQMVSVETSGMYKIGVQPKNTFGPAPMQSTTLYIGIDVPKAVRSLKAEAGANEGDVNVTWQQPMESLHGGFLDFSGMKYMVERCKSETDAVVIATTSELTIQDHIDEQGTIRPYFYRVTPMTADDRKGEAAVSNSIGIGKPLSLPYYQPFDDASSFDIITIVDRHNDGKTWEHDATFEAARAQYDWTNPKNEWLITPPMHLTAERVYKLSYDTWCRDGYTERLEVKFGKGKKYTDMTEQILPRTEIANATPQQYFHLVKIADDGDYNFGFHAVSEVDKWWLYLDNIKVEAGPLLGTPNKVNGLNATAAELGQLKATLAFSAPTKSVDGITLTEISGIAIQRNGKLIATVNAQPGEAVTFTDENAVQGDNKYTVIPQNDKGDGLESEVTVYVGVGIPTAPTDVKLRKVDDMPVVSWKAPQTSVNGAYVDTEKLVYYVVRNDNAQVASQITETTFTDNTLKLKDGEQAFATYAVFAQNVAGLDQEQYGMSNEVCFGTPYELPFHESFKGVTLEAGPWTWDIIDGDPYLQITAAAEYPNAAAQDNDGGLVSFKPEAVGDEAMLYSANISLVGAQKPQLSFWYYNNPGSMDKISARVRIDDDPENVVEVKYINMNASSGKEGWTEAVCPLDEFIGHRVQLVFRFLSASDYYIHLDNINVTGLRNDLPGISNLAATCANGSVTLTWDEPIDDQGLGFIGYNIYRNGSLINDEPVVDPEYTDIINTADPATLSYQVSVVYTEGETMLSAPVTPGIDGISGISAGNNAPAVIYDLQGRRLITAPIRGTYILNGKKRAK